MNFSSQFHRYADVIASLPDGFVEDIPLTSSLTMERDQRHAIYYAPFDHVTESAKVVIIGITPGRFQAIEALLVARRMLRAGADQAAVMAQAKTAASFAGPMRRNLIDLLDYVGVGRRLGIATTADLWGPRADLAHFTSALRYPVFENGENYGGNRLLQSPLLRDQINRWFGAEARSLHNALFVPLGPAALQACEHLVSNGELRNAQVLRGLPHPSGANAERIAYFLGRKDKASLSSRTNHGSLDAGREAALRCVASWP